MARLAHADTLVLGAQLPLPQLLVVATRHLAPDPFWTRLVFSAIGAAVPLALAWALDPLAGGAYARPAAVLTAAHPLLVYYSIVPYQESPMLLGLLLAAAALQRGRTPLAALALGLACLCRYEAWIAIPLAAVGVRSVVHAVMASSGGPQKDEARRVLGTRRVVCGLRQFLLFGWAPLGWIFWWRGLSPPGTYVLDLDPQSGRLARAGFLLAKLREYSGDAAVALAVVGGLLLLPAWRRPAWRVPLAYGLLFVVATIAAGHEWPAGSGHVAERMAHVPAVALCVLAAAPLAWVAERGRAGLALAAGAAVVLVLAWTAQTRLLVAEANQAPALRLAVQVARALDALAPRAGTVDVRAAPVPAAALDAYVEKVRRVGGDAAAARVVADRLAATSPDLDLLLAHLPWGRVRVSRGPADLRVAYDAPAAGGVLELSAPPRRADLFRAR